MSDSLKDKKASKPPPSLANPSSVADADVEQWYDDEDAESAAEVDLAGDTSPAPDIAAKYARSQLRVVRETKDFTIDYLKQALNTPKYIINVAPEYQRRQRWTAKKRSLLIESFLMNIPIPPVFLFEHQYNSYEVVDGRQRLDAIREFLANGFSLVGLQYWKELNGKTFAKLPPVIQSGLLRRSIGAVVLLAESRRPDQDDFDVRTILFDRLNTGGEKLNPQELRNALFPGPFNLLLIKLARSQLFTSAWGIPPWTPDEDQQIPEHLARNSLFRTMADCELVLRFFAIRDALLSQHTGSLRRLLDRTMVRHQHASAESIQEMEQLFVESLSALHGRLGKDAFRLTNSGRLSRPLYDSLMVAHSLYHKVKKMYDPAVILGNIAKDLDDQAMYEILVGRGNTIEAVRSRVQLAAAILFEET
jgi:Protein of unknown function DUF262